MRGSLTKTVRKARILPNRVVMNTSGAQYDRWKQATSKELQAFLKTALKEPTPEVRSQYFGSKKKVVMQLLVFSLKPMTAEEKAQGLVGDEYEKARICLQGQNHEGFQVQSSTTKRRCTPPQTVPSSASKPQACPCQLRREQCVLECRAF